MVPEACAMVLLPCTGFRLPCPGFSGFQFLVETPYLTVTAQWRTGPMNVVLMTPACSTACVGMRSPVCAATLCTALGTGVTLLTSVLSVTRLSGGTSVQACAIKQ